MHPTETARRLLGATLTRVSADGAVSVLITETEAYGGHYDPASHAYRGRTPRNGVMFGPANHLYVYRSHGLHWCANITCGVDGQPSAVLLRAGRISQGLALARRRRGAKVAEHKLASGPGNLARALGITDEDNGADLARSSITVALGPELNAVQVRRGPRVGVTGGPDALWRFWIATEPTVSAYRRSPRAVADSGGSDATTYHPR
ncbi:MAG: DNA-3-methyladenine glycosylase [Nocardioides sp.]